LEVPEKPHSPKEEKEEKKTNKTENDTAYENEKEEIEGKKREREGRGREDGIPVLCLDKAIEVRDRVRTPRPNNVCINAIYPKKEN